MDSSDAGTESVPQLESLAPRYSKEQHGAYFAILKRAIEKQSEVRNIALAGSYGAGKSSVLRRLAEEFPDRVIEVSLLTLGVEPEPVAPGKESNSAAGTTTNRIQKEIVKQLLYQQSPSQAPESRFRRITPFRWGREAVIAVLAGVVTLAVMVAAGFDVSVMGSVGLALPTPPNWLRAVMSYLAIVGVAGLVVLLVRLLVQGRLGIEKVTAGPATITLPPRSSSYFDEYLDEIIYFFETNKRRDILILEDLDRFNDARIFESLRSLNGLLNTSRQLDGRNIRFIYAVRDSVFERLGRDEALAATDEARAELVRANRTKFFELVVPVVPFITHKNARDLMHDLLTRRGHTVSKDLVDLAARHVADMRLIHNIVNEYEVFRHHLLEVPTPVPQLDAERLFAMILFKNAHMADFEAIRQGASSLDDLYATWRDLVSSNLRRLRTEDAKLRSRIENQTSADEYAATLADRLRTRIGVFADAPGSGLAGSIVKVDGSVVGDEELKTPVFWLNLIESEGSITLTAQQTGRGNHQAMTLSLPALETLLDMRLDSRMWVEHSVAADKATIRKNQADAGFLRRHTWHDLVDRAQFTYAASKEETAKSFRQWVQHHLPSRLAVDLVVSGYITSYFSLHVSAFYGQLIRPDAMTYIMRNVDHGTADADYVLDAADVEAILRDQGRSVLTERSMYNVSILDHLLTGAPEDASVVVGRLADGGPEERTFLDHYMSEGSAKRELVAQLTPTVPTVFTYIVGQAPLHRDEKAALLDVAITRRNDETDYEFTDELRSFIETEYRNLASLTEAQGDALPAARAVRFITDAGALLPDVTNLSDAACDALAHTRSYLLTAQNLERLAQTDDIALDRLKQKPDELYPYAIDHLENFLQAYSESANTNFTINERELFIEILNASETWRQAEYDRLVHGASPACEVENLQDVPTPAWPALTETHRVPATFDNVAAYVKWEGEVDTHLAALLSTAVEITEIASAEEPARKDLAVAILNAGNLLTDPSHRIDLALSLKPGTLPTSSIEPERGELVGLLIASQLIEDDEDAFDARLMADWPTLEYTITSSSGYAEIVGPETLPTEHIAPLMRSGKVSTAVKRAVVDQLHKFGAVPRDAYQAVADCALQSMVSLSATGIDMVRQGGARSSSVLELLAQAGGRVSVDDLRQTLRAMGKPYSVIADKGKQRPKLSDTHANRAILDRLRAAGIVSQFAPEKESMLRVTLKQT